MFVPEPVRLMMSKLLAVRVVNRYATCEELLLDWESFAKERDRKPVRPVAEENTPAVGRSIPLWGWVVGGIVLLGIIIGILAAARAFS